MAAARKERISFFDDARYNDETGKAPIPTGYSEILFGDLFRGAGVRQDEVHRHRPGPNLKGNISACDSYRPPPNR